MSLVLPPELLSIRDWIRWGASLFDAHELHFGHGTDNAWDEAALLVLWVLHQPWERIDSILDCHLTQGEKQTLLDVFIERIEQRIPAAYITGEMMFAGLNFKVTSDVLVPRSPFAELIQQQFQPWLDESPERILDLCSGSGCIGIACAHAFPEASVDLADISALAVALGKENIARFALEQRVECLQSDGFEGLPGRRYDLIVSNPPYVSEDEYAELPEEYLAEPKLGLTSGDDGLDFTRYLLENAADYLNDDGLLVVEVGFSAETLAAAYPHVPFFWPDFSNGGSGIFMLTREQLIEYF